MIIAEQLFSNVIFTFIRYDMVFRFGLVSVCEARYYQQHQKNHRFLLRLLVNPENKNKTRK